MTMQAKWKRVSVLTLLMGSSFAAGAWASDGIQQVQAYLRSDFKVVVDGQAVTLDNPPLIYNDKSYLPLKKIGELLNADVRWQDSTKTIYVNPRFAGQPETPASADTYPEIVMQQPMAYQATYLGGEYGLLSIIANQSMYFRAEDLARMGIDTRGMQKSREKYTGYLFVTQEDMMSMWKQDPYLNMSYEPVTSGIYDAALKKGLLQLATESIPLINQLNISQYAKISRIFYIDTVPDHPDYYYLYGVNDSSEIIVYVAHMAQNSKGEWSQDSLQSTKLEYLSTFFNKS